LKEKILEDNWENLLWRERKNSWGERLKERKVSPNWTKNNKALSKENDQIVENTSKMESKIQRRKDHEGSR